MYRIAKVSIQPIYHDTIQSYSSDSFRARSLEQQVVVQLFINYHKNCPQI